MGREVLSLKSIYKFLTLNDYPVYSEGIIKKDNRIGLTLNKFYLENILVDFKNRKTGKILWRAEGSRNRYLSEICNRSDRLSLYKDYAEEVMLAADYDTVLRQIRQYMSFLLERQYNAENFSKKIPAMIEMYERGDDAFTPEAAAFFYHAMDERKSLEGQGTMVDTFCCGWILTMFTIHALMGNGEGEEYLHKIRSDKNYSLLVMLKRYQEEKEEQKGDVVFLTGENTELSCPPLKSGHFFGREVELFELREMLMHGGAYLISGMGGSGKTELMRQFLKTCVEESLVDYIGIIQFEGGLAKSFVKAFPQVHGIDLNENYQEVLARIQMLGHRKVLLIIDNMDGGVDEKELEALCKLPVTIFITSRYQKMKGFKSYRLKSIGQEAASLIFRDNYGSYLNEEDKLSLDEIIQKDLWCHTLTLRLLARTAKNNGWSLQKLKEQLNIGNAPQGYTETERYEGLRQVYCQMYDSAKLTRNETSLLRIFAAMPYRNYELEWSKKYLQCLLKGEAVEAVFDDLWTKGWLEKSETGYSMHPFISECVLSTVLTESECKEFFDGIFLAWEGMGKTVRAELIPEILYENDKYMELDAELIQTTMLIRPMLTKLSGKFTEKYAALYLIAVAMESVYYGITKAGLACLEKIKARSQKLSKITNLGLHIMLCGLQQEDLDGYLQLFEQMKEDETIPESMRFALAENLEMRFYHKGDTTQSEILNDYLLEKCMQDSIRIAAYSVKACLSVQKGDYDAYAKWLQKGIALGRKCGRTQGKDMQLLISNLCDLYMAIGRFDEAETLLTELENIAENKSYFLKQHILHRRGNLAMYCGEEGFGVSELTESEALAAVLYKKSEPSNYATVVVDLAMALNKAKQFEESAKQYKKALDIYNSLEGYDFEKHRILNNMSVMYLDRNMPETALNYLPEAYKRGKSIGGLALAETANNYSKACHALGNREKELEYLKEALPVLEQFYGSEHPKVVDAKARFME